MTEYSLSDSYEYCRKLTRRYGPNFSLGFIFLPRAKRQAVYAAYAFCRYADDIVDETPERGDMERGLAQWTEALHRAYGGEATHPILIALGDSANRYNISKSPFLELIEGCRMDLEKQRYETFDELLDYCQKVASTISSISLTIFGFTSEKAPPLGDNLSTALQLTNILRDVGDDIGRDRIYLPLEELRKFGVSEDELLRREVSPKTLALLEFQVDRIRRYFSEAEPLIPLIDRDARFTVYVMAEVYRAIAEKIAANLGAVLTRRIALNRWQKIALIIKLAWRYWIDIRHKKET